MNTIGETAVTGYLLKTRTAGMWQRRSSFSCDLWFHAKLFIFKHPSGTKTLCYFQLPTWVSDQSPWILTDCDTGLVCKYVLIGDLPPMRWRSNGISKPRFESLGLKITTQWLQNLCSSFALAMKWLPFIQDSFFLFSWCFNTCVGEGPVAHDQTEHGFWPWLVSCYQPYCV